MANLNLPFFLVLIAVFLQIADITTTYYGLKMGLVEANPFFNWNQAVLKVFLPLLNYVVYDIIINSCSESEQVKAKLCFEGIWLIVIFIYVFIVARNLWLIVKVKLLK